MAKKALHLVSAAEASFLGAVKTLQDMGFNAEQIAEVFGGKPKQKSTETEQKGSVEDTKSS